MLEVEGAWQSTGVGDCGGIWKVVCVEIWLWDGRSINGKGKGAVYGYQSIRTLMKLLKVSKIDS